MLDIGGGVGEVGGSGAGGANGSGAGGANGRLSPPRSGASSRSEASVWRAGGRRDEN